ncbi:MAG: NADH-quinone oxidoreductase subunit C [Planctomycetes bacterium]|nr:NADH-quinone oxidoreductase subunit C [Planctomycetota bacterium]
MADDDINEQDQELEEPQVEPSQDEVLAGVLSEKYSLNADPLHKWGLCMFAQADTVFSVLQYLRDQQGFQVLLDLTVVDYLTFPGHRDERFAVVYILKNLNTCQRISIKVMLEEDDATIDSVGDMWLNADWSEREAYDQYGIVLKGHHNLKRLLNHHEFVGHPLRKDYPAQKRQKLTENDPMLDQLHGRMQELGYQIIEGVVDGAVDQETLSEKVQGAES